MLEDEFIGLIVLGLLVGTMVSWSGWQLLRVHWRRQVAREILPVVVAQNEGCTCREAADIAWTLACFLVDEEKERGDGRVK